jgi:hypothetical protein
MFGEGIGVGELRDGAYYRRMAIRLIEIAANTSTRELKMELLVIAAEFEKLAEYTEAKNSAVV